MRVASAGVVVASVLVVLVACGGDREEAVSVEGSAGFQMQAGEGVELPDDFPDDVPAYPNWKVLASVNAQGGMLVTAHSSDSPDAIVAFYKDEFSDAGWNVQAEMNMGAQRMVAFEKGDRQVTLTAGRDAEETQISLMVNQ